MDADWKLSKRVEARGAVRARRSAARAAAARRSRSPSTTARPATPAQVLDILDRHGAKATFFIVGRNAEHNTALVRRTVESGHEIGNHTWSHASLPALPKAARHQEVEGANDVVRSAVGHQPRLFRPPYGAMRPGTNREVRRAGLLPVVWSVDTRDYEPGVTAKLADRARRARRCGPARSSCSTTAAAIAAKTVAALPKILDEIERQGYRAVTVTQLLNDAPPEPDDLAGRM